MKIHVENRSCFFFSFFVICFFLLIQTSHQQNTTCPFQYIYHFGDGITDIGNSIRVLPFGPFLPSTRPPYGTTFPGRPTGRWSDGRVDVDYIDGVVETKITFKGLLRDKYNKINQSRVISNADCAVRLANSLIALGDIEGNDYGYPLAQGKSIQEVNTYVPFVIRALIEAATELIRMGATRVVIAGSVPVGCYPYILTALQTNNAADYDNLGCLKSVNDFIVSKNQLLQEAVTNLAAQFSNVGVYYGDLYGPVQTIIQESLVSGNMTLKACCGIGGKYNYNSRRFCGSRGVPVCANPDEYIYWDGLHFTQEAYARYTDIVVQPFLPVLGCTSN
ncbi:hypothetical protein MIMGU_mgv1a009776mg [Erythranthe guttata]|uniref:Uncharacterized protein n=1 Tax=Erythranthe guttata TaxID=4155 RepID=A0A022R3S3_ERYGU|nr:hypothetical protein MIMGU_mgv1a009776mg [Erythranthe guttata]